MKKILVGFKRSAGDFTDKKGKKVEFDNVWLYCMDFEEPDTCGFTGAIEQGEGKVPAYKVKTSDFEEVVGITFPEFVTDFAEKYQYHRMRAMFEENDYGDAVVTQIKFSDLTCFDLLKKQREAEAALAAATAASR